MDDTFDTDEIFEVPITNELDLHCFQPREIKSVLLEYLSECIRLGITPVRIIHGKGKSVQKHAVQKALAAHPSVRTFHDAPPNSGGWGATIAELDIISQ